MSPWNTEWAVSTYDESIPPDATEPAIRSPYHHGDLRRALLDAARALMHEQRSWDFSLRELARRAGVSHNAPYKHFAEKRALLAALAQDGFERLTAGMVEAASQAPTSSAALVAIGHAYVRFGRENPAHYRLMFGPLGMEAVKPIPQPVMLAGAAAKSVLRDAIGRGAVDGSFTVPASDRGAVEVTLLTTWSVVHGLTMLFIDGLTGDAAAGQPADRVVEAVLRRYLAGMVRP
jgi:AcrR family transcriptional regulator